MRTCFDVHSVNFEFGRLNLDGYKFRTVLLLDSFSTSRSRKYTLFCRYRAVDMTGGFFCLEKNA